MKITQLFRIIILNILFALTTVTTFAGDALDDEVASLTAMPTVEVLEGININGSTGSVNMLTDPNTGNSVGTIQKNDGSIVTITRSSGINGSWNYSMTNNGITTTATVNSDGTTTGDPTLADIASSDADCPGKWDSEFGCPGDLDKAIDKVAKDNAAEESKKVVTIVSEMVPGADCFCYIGNKVSGNKNESCKTGDITTRKYQCTTDSGMTGFQKVFAKMIRFVINIVMLLGVLAVVGLGIAWSFAGGDDMKMKSTLKTWAINLVIGFIILFMFRYILQFLAPWIYK